MERIQAFHGGGLYHLLRGMQTGGNKLGTTQDTKDTEGCCPTPSFYLSSGMIRGIMLFCNLDSR